MNDATSNAAAARQAADDATLTKAHTAWLGVDPERARMIATVLRYRSAWRELAEALEDCERRLLWQRWGFGSFDAYCAEELRLPKALMTRYRNALAFLREAGAQAAEVPLQSVEVARQALAAGEAGEIPPEEAGEIVTKALDGSEGPRQLAQDLHEARQRAFEPRLFGGGPDPAVLAKARKAWARLEVVTKPLREQMPAHVVDALEVVTAYLKAPEPVAASDREEPQSSQHMDASSQHLAGSFPQADKLAAADAPDTGGQVSSLPTDEAAGDVPVDAAPEVPAAQVALQPVNLSDGEELTESANAEQPTYEREDGPGAAATPQGQDLLRRCEEMLWLQPRTAAADLAPLRAALTTQIERLSAPDRNALQAALGAQRWDALAAALGGKAKPAAVEERTVVYDE